MKACKIVIVRENAFENKLQKDKIFNECLPPLVLYLITVIIVSGSSTAIPSIAQNAI
jgi:hypothetical protein